MAVLAWTLPRIRLPVGASALCVVVLCWLYIFPVYRLPTEKEIVQGVLQQGTAWRRNQTAARVFRYLCPRGSSPSRPLLAVPGGQGHRRAPPRGGVPPLPSFLSYSFRVISERRLQAGAFSIPYPETRADSCFARVKPVYISSQA